MATDITGGNNQVGTSNRQFINSNNITINMNIHVNCTECHQHHHKEGISILGEDIHGVFDALQKIALAGRHTTPVTAVSEAAIQSHIDPAPQRKAAVTDSVRILDSHGHVLEPGDAICADNDFYTILDAFAIYVGDGYLVRYGRGSKTVVKEKLDMTRPFYKVMALRYSNLNEFTPEQRVQRALQQVGRPCPVPGRSGEDFVCWIFTGLSYEQIGIHLGIFSRWIEHAARVSIADSGYGFQIETEKNYNKGKRQGRLSWTLLSNTSLKLYSKILRLVGSST